MATDNLVSPGWGHTPGRGGQKWGTWEMGLKWRPTISNGPAKLGHTRVMVVEGKTVGRWAFNVD